MSAWICRTCGVQHPVSEQPPQHCLICEDERQYVGAEGQRWTTMAELAGTHRVEIRLQEPGLHGIGVEPSFAIGQRALLVQTPHGNLLWDCVSLLDEPTRQKIADLGGVAAIGISHPHFYSGMLEYAEAFGAPVYLPQADARWVQRPSSRITFFQDSVQPVPGLTMARIGGHFDGASVLHWPDGADGRGALLTGDTIQVVSDHRWVSFMWSYPNLLPLDGSTVRAIAERVEPFAFGRIYGGWWHSVVAEDGSAVVQRSAQRYLARLDGQRPG